MTNQSIANGSSTNDTSCNFFLEPRVSIYIRLAVTALILFVALVGNLMVLRAVCRLHGRIPLIYQLVANLAAGELGQVILAPFLLYYEETWLLNGWPFGEFLCKVINPLHNVFLTNVTLSMAAIAVYRCLILYFPPKTKADAFPDQVSSRVFLVCWCSYCSPHVSHASIETLPTRSRGQELLWNILEFFHLQHLQLDLELRGAIHSHIYDDHSVYSRSNEDSPTHCHHQEKVASKEWSIWINRVHWTTSPATNRVTREPS